MIDYLNFNDLKAAIISILVFFICLGIQRYWSNHIIKSVKRRIEQSEAYKANVNNLAMSDRALLIYGFQSIFGILAGIIFVFLI